MRWAGRLWKPVVGTLLSVLFLWLAFRQAQLKTVLENLAAARYWLLIPAVLLTMAAFAVRAWRWRFLLASVREIPFDPLFSSIMIGFMGNNVLPARLGELLRAHSLGRRTGISRSAVLASIVVERIFDIFVLLVLFGAILVLRGLPPNIQVWGWILLGLAAPLLVGLALFWAYSGPLIRLFLRLCPHALRPRVLHLAVQFRDGLGVLVRGRSILWSVLLSFLMWGIITVVVLFCFQAARLTLPAGAGVVVLVVMAIGTMIPSAPGYLGTLQYAGTLALLQYGVERSAGLSFTLIYHASQWFPVTLVGLGYFLRDHLSLRQIRAIEDSGEAMDLPTVALKPGPGPGAGSWPGGHAEDANRSE